MPVQAAQETESNKFKLQKKLIEEEKKRKEKAIVVKEWLEIVRLPLSKHGDKVRLVKLMENGNKHRIYLGKTKQIPEQLEEYKKRGLEFKMF